MNNTITKEDEIRLEESLKRIYDRAYAQALAHSIGIIEKYQSAIDAPAVNMILKKIITDLEILKS